MAGTIDNERLLWLANNPGVFLSLHGDQLFGAWCVDLTYTNGNFKTFVEGCRVMVL